MEAQGKFGEHEKCIRVAQGTAESSSSFLSKVKNMLTSYLFMHRYA